MSKIGCCPQEAREQNAEEAGLWTPQNTGQVLCLAPLRALCLCILDCPWSFPPLWLHKLDLQNWLDWRVTDHHHWAEDHSKDIIINMSLCSRLCFVLCLICIWPGLCVFAAFHFGSCIFCCCVLWSHRTVWRCRWPTSWSCWSWTWGRWDVCLLLGTKLFSGSKGLKVFFFLLCLVPEALRAEFQVTSPTSCWLETVFIFSFCTFFLQSSRWGSNSSLFCLQVSLLSTVPI